MITVNQLVFNGFQVNTYILSDETKECVIVDAANYEQRENQKLADFIEKNGLKPVLHINTHCHVDHVLGGAFVEEKYGLGVSIHPDSNGFILKAKEQAMMYGFNLNKTANISDFINEGEKIKFGNSELDIIYTPGHAAGSICIISHNDEFVITGDVLFHESIGRTDLPTGDFDLLKNNILNKLFTLPDVYTVYPGHGPETSIGHEKGNNPFL
jgi:hydroxyacylglutathione hydrolase